MMPNTKIKIIYSLRVHLELQRRGFNYETEMKNPQKQQFNCWVYRLTPELSKALSEILGGARNGR